MGIARNIARLIPNGSGLLPNANIEAVAASKLTGLVASANAVSGSVIQVVSTTTNAQLSGNLGATTNPTSTSGTSYVTLSFTPKLATSKLFLTTSAVAMEETSNDGDDFWLAAFYDTTRIACVSGSPQYIHFSSNLNMGFYSLNVLFDSWGTSAKTIDFRVGSSANGSSMRLNYNEIGMNSGARNYGFTVMEITP